MCLNFKSSISKLYWAPAFFIKALRQNTGNFIARNLTLQNMSVSKQYLKMICCWCRNNLSNLNELTFLPPLLGQSSVFHKGIGGVRGLNRIHWLSSSISCRNPCTAPEFKSGHEYGSVQLEFPYSKTACHSERQHQLLPSQAWNTKFRDYDKSGRPSSLTAMWSSRRMTC